MKKKGQLQFASKDINGTAYKFWYFTKLGKDSYLIIIPKTFRKDPFDFKFSFIREKKFRSLSKEYKLQELLTPLSTNNK